MGNAAAAAAATAAAAAAADGERKAGGVGAVTLVTGIGVDVVDECG